MGHIKTTASYKKEEPKNDGHDPPSKKLVGKPGRAQKGPEIEHDESIIVLFKSCHIRDNREWGDAEVNISFQFETGGSVVSSTLGTFSKVADGTTIGLRNQVVLPLTQVKDYFTLTVNAMEIDKATTLVAKLGNVLNYADQLVKKVPGAGTIGSEVISVVGLLVNLASELNEDDTLIRQVIPMLVDPLRYPTLEDAADDNNSPILYLKAGTIEIVEDDPDVKDPTRIVLQIIRPTAK